jgi:hypothetical protein
MPILIILLALLLPRGVILLLWFFSDWFEGMFETILWPILGFVFLPTTLLLYAAVQQWFGGEWGLWQIVGIVIALLIDTSPGHSRKKG